MYKCPICGKENQFVNQCGCDPNNLPTAPYIGRFARSIESDWLGKIVDVEDHDGDTMLRMHGVEWLCWEIAGGNIEDFVCPDDTQWFAPEDVTFVTVK